MHHTRYAVINTVIKQYTEDFDTFELLPGSCTELTATSSEAKLWSSRKKAAMTAADGPFLEVVEIRVEFPTSS